MTNEEYVRANWKDYFNPFCGREWQDFLTARPGRIQRFNGSEDDSASVMAEFTRDRLEQIRQLEREVLIVGSWVRDEEEWARGLDQWDSATASRMVRTQCTHNRILARLESALVDLKRGMRPDSLASSGG